MKERQTATTLVPKVDLHEVPVYLIFQKHSQICIVRKAQENNNIYLDFIIFDNFLSNKFVIRTAALFRHH